MNLLNMALRLNNTDYQKGIGNGKLQDIKIEEQSITSTALAIDKEHRS